MALIYRERLDIGPESPQIMVGTHVFHKEPYPPLRDRGIMMCGLSEGRDFFEVERVDTPWHVLAFCLSGRGEVFTPDGLTRTLLPGQLALMPASVHCGYRRIGTEPMQHVWFLLYCTSRWDYLHRTLPAITHSVDGATLADAMRQFHREVLRFNTNDTSNLAVPALDFLCLALERATQAFSTKIGWSEQLDQLFAHAQKNLQQDWTNAALAAQLHITTTHLHRLCMQHLGETPNKLIFRMKMNQAKELLLHGHRVGDVARASGYQEISSFSRRFRQYFGYNPSQVLSKHLSNGKHEQVWY
ncbi:MULTISPECIES: helix-turn-helix transcriptional regulator [Deefgea]|uniref:Helix-turn-helix domain-containing protein n=1 Tax=Deefgea chitinilytica TaxID=570276 RepID=A0ABS2CD97_9NEIS|nr:MULTISPECIES: AraC family transcriptional regulator [Deefgea]MBM5572017.1 helix-turn-helix domain-containing protein [Deefgea chitinilytica]MBM9889252.1 AraC family transcriptional regulator [Deefgea sp. CFH1-16]